MSASTNPTPQNILLLAALGIGAYWLLTRPAGARTNPLRFAPTFPTPAQNAQYRQYAATDNAMWGTLGAALGKGLDKLFTGAGQSPAQKANEAVAATQTSRSGTDSPSGDPYSTDPSIASSAGTDGIAYNPSGNAAPYDTVQDLGQYL